jgi:light-regulated signal transduction histidine kinase (bacteriophytochrome)
LNEIRKRVDDLEAEERALLNQRSQNVRDAAQRASSAWILGTIFSLVLLLVVFGVLNTEVRQRRKIEEEISQLNQQLEERVRERTKELEVANQQIKSIYEHLEHRVVERTEQLEAANKELEAFSYSVSHDLRAPLRALDGFSRILLEDYADQLDEDARDYLQIVRDNATQMGHLVDDLLAFSRLSRQTLETENIDMAVLVQRLMHDVRREAGERRVEFIVGALPPCKGDPALLKQVWLNLLLNAVKYSGEREVAVIEVGSCDVRDLPNDMVFAAQAAASPEASSTGQAATEEHVVYFVRDNGVGFDMEYSHKLFGVFQRLHRAEDYEGTGVGLAIVQRVLNRHGGRVWAKAEVGKGATFYFSLQRGEANV